MGFNIRCNLIRLPRNQEPFPIQPCSLLAESSLNWTHLLDWQLFGWSAPRILIIGSRLDVTDASSAGLETAGKPTDSTGAYLFTDNEHLTKNLVKPWSGMSQS